MASPPNLYWHDVGLKRCRLSRHFVIIYTDISVSSPKTFQAMINAADQQSETKPCPQKKKKEIIVEMNDDWITEDRKRERYYLVTCTLCSIP